MPLLCLRSDAMRGGCAFQDVCGNVFHGIPVLDSAVLDLAEVWDTGKVYRN